MSNITVQERFFETQYGSTIYKCIQCGTCSGSCPLTNKMDHAPRELFALIRDGEMEAALSSDTPWYCVSCYKCTVRCPKEIPVTDIMYTLKQLIKRYGSLPSGHKMPDMYHAFAETIAADGKVTESAVMRRYGMKHPLDTVKNIPLAVKLLKRSRLEIIPAKTDNPETVAKLLSGSKRWEENK